ncbi:hypothetical protein HPB50_017878 [Hyalomma asiaticum]|uniref:Uncharacterized protein n=1 Tax=Hyalomma asiaticum TaxID=266040 RepID=A0ACB7RJT6_HYAAI|nr:hypothetical protein HPB50_017878 [Hyalomma asiaticum]
MWPVQRAVRDQMNRCVRLTAALVLTAVLYRRADAEGCDGDPFVNVESVQNSLGSSSKGRSGPCENRPRHHLREARLPGGWLVQSSAANFASETVGKFIARLARMGRAPDQATIPVENTSQFPG